MLISDFVGFCIGWLKKVPNMVTKKEDDLAVIIVRVKIVFAYKKGKRNMKIALYDGSNEEVKQMSRCLRTLVTFEDDLEVFTTGTKLLKRIKENRNSFDVYFLPIEDSIGLEIAQQIRKTNLTALIIFSSQGNEQMSQVFEFHAFDYLLKPYASKKVEATLTRAKKYLNGNQNYVDFSFNREKYLLSMDEIIYVTKSGRIAYIHTKDEIYKSYMTMTEILAKLKGGRFVRVHGSYVINLNYVMKIVKDEIFLDIPESRNESSNEATISVSRRFKDEFQQYVSALNIPQGKH